LDDPVGVEAEALVQVTVVDDRVGDIAAGSDDADSGQAAAARARRRVTIIAHENLDRLWQGRSAGRGVAPLRTLDLRSRHGVKGQYTRCRRFWLSRPVATPDSQTRPGLYYGRPGGSKTS